MLFIRPLISQTVELGPVKSILEIRYWAELEILFRTFVPPAQGEKVNWPQFSVTSNPYFEEEQFVWNLKKTLLSTVVWPTTSQIWYNLVHTSLRTSRNCVPLKNLLRKFVESSTTQPLASCLIYGQPFRHISSPRPTPIRWQPAPISMLVWVRSFIEPDVLKTMYCLTIPLRFIWSTCTWN